MRRDSDEWKVYTKMVFDIVFSFNKREGKKRVSWNCVYGVHCTRVSQSLFV